MTKLTQHDSTTQLQLNVGQLLSTLVHNVHRYVRYATVTVHRVTAFIETLVKQ